MIDDRAHDALAPGRDGHRAGGARRAPPRPRPWSCRRSSALTRFANSQIHQNVAETNVVVNLRFVVGKRVGVASSGRTDDEGLRRLAANAAAIARVVEELEDWGGLPGPTEAEDVDDGYSQATAGGEPRVRGPTASARSSPRPTMPG